MYRAKKLFLSQLWKHCDSSSLLIIMVLTLPFLFALIWLILPAFGIHQALEYFHPGLDAFRSLLSEPGILRSLAVSFGTAIAATLGSLLFALLVIIYLTPSKLVAVCQPWLAFMLSVPHLSIVIGMQFFISPSGLISRFLAPWLDWSFPPSVQTVPDAWHLGYMFVLMVKEAGFVLMLVIAQLGNLPVDRYYKLGRSFGYSTPYIWLKILLPLIYPKIRLGLWVLFVFAATNVEIALFASPNSSLPFSLRVWQWFTDASLDTQLVASAGALLFFLVVAVALALFSLCEVSVKSLGHLWAINRSRGFELPRFVSLFFWRLLLVLHTLPLFVMLVWSVSQRWVFPHLTPQGFTLAFWSRSEVSHAFVNSVWVAAVVASFSILSVIAFSELSRGPIRRWQEWVFYAPLIVPQIGLVFGVYVMTLFLDVNGSLTGIIIAQLLFALPYGFIVLGNAWQSFDERYLAVASSLGKGYFSVLFRVKLPLLLRPVLFTWALVFTVSINLYLPALYAGEGRVDTLVTELVSLGSSYDRRLIGVLASCIALSPMVAFLIAAFLPNFLYGRYRIEH